MSTSTSIVPVSALNQGGLGLTKKFLRLRPQDLELVQPTSDNPGNALGKFRVKATGQVYDNLKIVLLAVPQEPRAFWEPGGDFGAEPLCRSDDGIFPSANAVVPQAARCAGCPRADWSKWKKSKRREDLPQCKDMRKLFFVHRETKIPFRLQVKGNSIKPLDNGLNHIAMLIQIAISEGGNPNIFDFSMTLGSKKSKNAPTYEVTVSEVAMIGEGDRGAFGALFEQYVLQAKADAEAAEAEASADGDLSESKVVEGEIVEP